MKKWIAETIRRTLSAAAAGWMAVCLVVPAQALGEPNITPDTTIGEIRANESIIGSGFNTLDRTALWPEQPWQYTSWTLEEYLGPSAPDAAAGMNLLIENYNSGVQITYKIYTPEEIAADPSKDQVELYYFPARQPGAKYALVLPGNMFEKSAKMREGCSTCYHLHEMGYASFILRYSIGRDNSGNAAYNDLVRAVEFITRHADEFGVQPEDYALVGYSAGGQLCGIFGTDRMGYSKYGLPKPGALLLGYPIVNYVYVKPIYFYLLDGAKPGDDLAPGDYYYNIELSAEVSANYPPTYHWFGRDDMVLLRMNIFQQGPALDRALERSGVLHKMVVYDHAPHCTSTGIGTDANGWLYDAAAFWEEAVAAKQGSERG